MPGASLFSFMRESITPLSLENLECVKLMHNEVVQCGAETDEPKAPYASFFFTPFRLRIDSLQSMTILYES